MLDGVCAPCVQRSACVPCERASPDVRRNGVGRRAEWIFVRPTALLVPAAASVANIKWLCTTMRSTGIKTKLVWRYTSAPSGRRCFYRGRRQRRRSQSSAIHITVLSSCSAHIRISFTVRPRNRSSFVLYYTLAGASLCLCVTYTVYGDMAKEVVVLCRWRHRSHTATCHTAQTTCCESETTMQTKCSFGWWRRAEN